MGNLPAIDVAVLVFYFLAMASLGPIFASKARTTEGYFLGDRDFPGWIIGFSMFATSISSVTFMSYPADGFRNGWFRIVPGLALPIAIVVALYFFLPFFRRNRITSAYEYLEARFGPVTRVYAAAAFILAQIARVSMILYLIAVLLNEMFDLNPWVSILLGGMITTFYSVLGGIRAVVWTDFIQSLVMWAGGIFAIVCIIYYLEGGLGEVFRVAIADGKFAFADMNRDTGEMIPFKWTPDLTQKTVLLFFLVGIGNWLMEYSANQNVIQRYAACSSAKQARIAIITNVCFSVPTWCLFMFIGTAIYVYYKANPSPEAEAIRMGLEGHKADEIFPFFIINVMPPGFTGLVIAAVLAAAMSSLSSSLNSVSAVGVVDIYRRHMVTTKNDDHYVLIAKGIGWAMGVVMCLGAAALYFYQNLPLLDVSNILTALTSGGLLGIYLLGMFTRRGDDRAMITAIIVTVAFTLYMALVQGKFLVLPESAPGALLALARIDSYYVGLIGHTLLFMIAFILASFLPHRERDLRNLTIYTQDNTPLD